MKITVLDRLFLFVNRKQKQKQVHRTQGLMWQNPHQMTFLEKSKSRWDFFTCIVEKEMI